MASSFFDGVLTVGLQLALPPFLVILTLVLFLASFGKSLGVRRLYVKVLLHVFEWARNVAKEHTLQKRQKSAFILGGDADDLDEDDDSDKTGAVDELTPNDDLEERRKKLKSYGKETRHNVISRKDNLLLSPDKPALPEKQWSTKVMAGKKISVESFRREFELSDVLDYVKTGIGSVIEDEVTQRFVAEELKSWNLLTRTSQTFEFVNIRLTVIWIVGFVVRYFVLLPGRAVILAVGVKIPLNPSLYPCSPFYLRRRQCSPIMATT